LRKPSNGLRMAETGNPVGIALSKPTEELGDTIFIVAVVRVSDRKILTHLVPISKGVSKKVAKKRKQAEVSALQKVISNKNFEKNTEPGKRLAVLAKDKTFLVFRDADGFCFCALAGRNIVHPKAFLMIHEVETAIKPFKEEGKTCKEGGLKKHCSKLIKAILYRYMRVQKDSTDEAEDDLVASKGCLPFCCC